MSAPQGAEHEVSIHALAAGGAGVGRLPDGKVVFVPRTAPGDTARVRVGPASKRWARGELLHVVRAGPDRQPAPCAVYGECGGCSLQHLDYQRQLAAKADIVRDALQRIAGVELDPPEVAPSPDRLRYRNRITMTVRRLRGGRVLAGFHAVGRPSRIVDVDAQCLLPEARLGEGWSRLRAHWGPGAFRLPGGTELRLTLRAVVEGFALVIHGGGGDGRPGELVQRVDGLRAVWKSTSEAPPRLLAGDSGLTDPAGGPLHPTAFAQVNTKVARLLTDHVIDAAGDVAGRTVVDAYCGVGSYARPLAAMGAEVVGIEQSAESVQAALASVTPGLRVVVGTVEDHLTEALPADLVIVNPPRAGLDARVTAVLASDGPVRLLYVSCDPATLARDVKRLGGAYSLAGARCFDLFPQTAHVETVAVLERAGPGVSR